MRIVLLGPPGAGKGTLAGLIKEQVGTCHIATGDILREEMKSGSDLGVRVKKYVESGALVPDDVVIAIIENKLLTDNSVKNGYLLDGFPRTEAQAKALDVILKKINKPVDVALYMNVELPVIIQRLTGRRVCRECGNLFHATNKPPKVANKCDSCGGELYQRADDNEETIRKRMKVYSENTAPIIGYYQEQGKLQKVEGTTSSQELLNNLIGALNEGKKSNPDKIS